MESTNAWQVEIEMSVCRHQIRKNQQTFQSLCERYTMFLVHCSLFTISILILTEIYWIFSMSQREHWTLNNCVVVVEKFCIVLKLPLDYRFVNNWYCFQKHIQHRNPWILLCSLWYRRHVNRTSAIFPKFYQKFGQNLSVNLLIVFFTGWSLCIISQMWEG